MRAIRRHIAAFAALSALSLSVGILIPVAGAWAAAASNPVTNNPALQKQVQEALAKAQAQKAPGGSAAGSIGSEAGGSSFSKLTEKSGEEEAATTTTATKKTVASESTGALSSGVVLPILVAVGGVLAAIAFLILRDARSVTPAGDLLAPAGAAEARAVRLRKRRAKAKAARQQRKRNR
jgi:hypothetical protein